MLISKEAMTDDKVIVKRAGFAGGRFLLIELKLIQTADRQLRARLAPMIDFGVWQGRLGPAVRPPQGN